MVIGIDMGHTVLGPNSGAVGIMKESEETRVIGNKVIYHLNQLGHKVVNCTVDYAISNNDSLRQRTLKANAQELNLFVSIHFNAGGGYGSEVFTQDATSLVQAKDVLSKMSKIGFANRGIKDGSDLYVIRNTKATAMLIEVCFVDNQVDVTLYKSNLDAIAKAITEGITGNKIDIELNDNGDDDMISDSVKVHGNPSNPISLKMIEEIKSLQKVMNLPQDGVATERLVRALPELVGIEARGVVTIMQNILILKGMLSKGSATGIIGNANKSAINRFKQSVGIPTNTKLVDRQTWRKLLEY